MVTAPNPHQRIGQGLLEDATVAVADASLHLRARRRRELQAVFLPELNHPRNVLLLLRTQRAEDAARVATVDANNHRNAEDVYLLASVRRNLDWLHKYWR